MPRTLKPAPKTRKPAQATRSQPRPPHGTQRPRSPISRKAVRALSIIGTQDKDVLAQFPGLSPHTLRTWRARDPIWAESFEMLKPEGTAGRKRNVTKEREAAQQSEIIASLEATLPAISSRNTIRAANEADRALAKVEKRKTPLPIGSWSEYKQAYSVLRLATGQDSAEGAQVQVNIWGVPGQASAGIAPAFRDVTSRPAIAAPAEPRLTGD